MDIGRHSAFGQYHRHLHWLTLALLLMASTATAQDVGFFRGDSFIKINRGSKIVVAVDTGDAQTRAYIKRLADSAAANRAGSTDPLRGVVWQRLFCTFGNAANDSVNMTINVNGVFHSLPLPYDMYLDRFMLQTDEPDARAPSQFRLDLPRVTTDSAFLFRLSRNNSFPTGSKMGFTVYKVPVNGGLTYLKTAGTFYDMIRFDEIVMPPTGTNAQVIVQQTLTRVR